LAQCNEDKLYSFSLYFKLAGNLTHMLASFFKASYKKDGGLTKEFKLTGQ
jgi:hypothetical protein